MNLTMHCKKRMIERGINIAMLHLLEAVGIWKAGTDKVMLSGSEAAEMEKELRSFLKTLEKIKRRGGVTVVEVEGKLLTTYFNDSYNRKACIRT